MGTATTHTTTVRQVHSLHGRNHAYLEIVRENEHRVRVQPTGHGKRALNRFWTMWLRKLLLEQAPQHRAYGVEVRNNCVIVTANASMDALIGTVHQIAAELLPLKDPPIVLGKIGDSGKKERRYELKIGSSQQIDWEGVVDGIQMPVGVRLELTYWPEELNFPAEGHIRLLRPIDHPLSLRQLGMLLELEVALACHQ